jgi:spermidine synthase
MPVLYDAAGQNCWITVTEEAGNRSLYLNECEEGAMSLETEAPVFDYLWFYKCAHLLESPLRRALILGAGPFTSSKCLALDFPQAEMDAVDVEADLEAIARKFFRLDQPAFTGIHFYPTLAEQFLLAVSAETYDFMFDDLFDGFLHVPVATRTPAYLQSLRRAVSKDGLCVKNLIWSPIVANSRDACKETWRAWQSIFPNHLSVALADEKGGHNVLLLGAENTRLDWGTIQEHLAQAGVPSKVLKGVRLWNAD